MAQPNNVFDSIAEIIARQNEAEERARQDHEELLEAIKRSNDEASAERAAIDRRNRAFSIKNFIKRSVHEYMWIGDAEEFKKEKRITVILLLASVFCMLASTVVVSVLWSMYSTYTLFENIWLLLSLYMLKYTVKAKKNYPIFEYSMNSIERFRLDSDGVLRTDRVKKKYKWFLALSIIAVLLNVICAWIIENNAPWLITVLELLTLVINIAAYKRVYDFFFGYGPIRFTGMNDAGTEKVVIIFDTLENKLYLEADYLKKYPFMT